MKELNIEIFRFGKKKFQKRYGKKTSAVTEPCYQPRKRCEIHIRRDLSPKTYKFTRNHEIGHVLADNLRLKKNLSKETKERLKEFSKEFSPSFAKGLRRKHELVDEALANIYSARLRSKKERLVIKKRFPKVYKLLDSKLKKIKLKVENINV